MYPEEKKQIGRADQPIYHSGCNPVLWGTGNNWLCPANLCKAGDVALENDLKLTCLFAQP